MARLLTTAMRFAQQHVRHVDPVPPRRARGLVADVYAQVERDFGMLAPPVSLHSPSPEVLAAAWLVLRETLLAAGLASRADKEAVATAVSEANDCPYCVEVHGATQDRVGPPSTSARWVSGGGAVPDPVAEHIGVAVCFEYLNRMAHVFLPESPFPPQAPAAARKQARKVLGRIAAPPKGVPAESGAAIGLLPNAVLPADLSWADGTVAVALARATAAFDAAGERAVDPVVRALVLRHLSAPDGPGLSRSWVDEAVAELPQAQRPAGKLALLVACAPYQVDDAVVAGLQADDAALVDLCAWAAWTAARHAGLRYAGSGVAP